MEYRVTFSTEDNTFLLENNKEQFNIEYVLKPYTDYNPDDYLVYGFLNKYGYAENDIFQVVEKNLKRSENGNGRIGWIFPLQALISNEHDFAGNEHFLKYAFVAFLKLLKADDNIITNEAINETNEINSLRDLYIDDLIILILSKSAIFKIKEFELKDYLISLYEYGFYIINSIDDFKSYAEVAYEDDFVKPKEKIHINPVCSYLKGYDYIYILLKELIYEKHYLVKFHLLYQVIELMIERVLKEEVKREVIRLNEDIKYEIKAHDVLEKMQKISTEKTRVSLLFNGTYKSGDIMKKELRDSCNNLLVEILKQKISDGEVKVKEEEIETTLATVLKNDVGDALYKVRNFLVHNYRSLKSDYVQIMKTINNEFEKVILDFMFSYKE